MNIIITIIVIITINATLAMPIHIVFDIWLFPVPVFMLLLHLFKLVVCHIINIGFRFIEVPAEPQLAKPM